MQAKPAAKKAPSSRAEGVVTLEQVAARAGVSPSTVSRILNGTATVSALKRAAVDEAISSLGFRPNPVARGLAGGRTMSIGVVTQRISSPFYGEALSGIEVELEAAGYVPLFVSGNWNEADERKAIETLLSRRVDGVIVLAGRLDNQELEALSDSVPMVVVGRQVTGERLFSFSFDNRAGARLATEHLISLGHRRIALLLGDLIHDDAIDRQHGYFDALAAAGIPVEPELIVPSDYTEAGGMLSISRLMERDVAFSAIFSSNDQMAYGAILGLARRNLRVPDDVSIVGFDDLIMSRYTMPPLSTVRHSVYETGAQAAGAMLSLLRGEAPAVQLAAPELVLRESVRRAIR
ncbi:LacI family transcriptional regulator [Paucibacter sp. DJ1R-11]|uniref:LacI family DNA-binding transcriptional regulator n=1 Tax=Paucibacter sp. DJ1R-11 TaxID=2893556 RepID=UPI0021E46AFD|nr:LacI family DNA-binding transcriptional regulator [Paucibacter sp. DJ1R-11]MCV2365106.1 LacI family transcriptional regulator [Paucibacter sp. DJ1R-11]